MRLYELTARISEILTPETNSFYDYILHTSDDDGGFLRTRFCYWEKPLPDRKIADLEQVLICFKNAFHEGDAYYEKDDFCINTLIKMQIFYYDTDIDSAIEWSRQLGYLYACIIDLKDGTYTVTKYDLIT